MTSISINGHVKVVYLKEVKEPNEQLHLIMSYNASLLNIFGIYLKSLTLSMIFHFHKLLLLLIN